MVEALEAEREALTKLLLTSDRDAIHQRIQAIDKLTAVLIARLPPAPDNRSVWQRGVESMKTDPIYVGAPALVGFLSFMWIGWYLYTSIRHMYVPYTEGQMSWRERLLHPGFQGHRSVPPPGMRTFALSVFFLAVRGAATHSSRTSRY